MPPTCRACFNAIIGFASSIVKEMTSSPSTERRDIRNDRVHIFTWCVIRPISSYWRSDFRCGILLDNTILLLQRIVQFKPRCSVPNYCLLGPAFCRNSSTLSCIRCKAHVHNSTHNIESNAFSYLPISAYALLYPSSARRRSKSRHFWKAVKPTLSFLGTQPIREPSPYNHSEMFGKVLIRYRSSIVPAGWDPLYGIREIPFWRHALERYKRCDCRWLFCFSFDSFHFHLNIVHDLLLSVASSRHCPGKDQDTLPVVSDILHHEWTLAPFESQSQIPTVNSYWPGPFSILSRRDKRCCQPNASCCLFVLNNVCPFPINDLNILGLTLTPSYPYDNYENQQTNCYLSHCAFKSLTQFLRRNTSVAHSSEFSSFPVEREAEDMNSCKCVSRFVRPTSPVLWHARVFPSESTEIHLERSVERHSCRLLRLDTPWCWPRFARCWAINDLSLNDLISGVAVNISTSAVIVPSSQREDTRILSFSSLDSVASAAPVPPNSVP